MAVAFLENTEKFTPPGNTVAPRGNEYPRECGDGEATEERRTDMEGALRAVVGNHARALL
jgi:hypothetical protein